MELLLFCDVFFCDDPSQTQPPLSKRARQDQFGHTAGCYMAGIDYASIAADRLQAQVQGLFICRGSRK